MRRGSFVPFALLRRLGRELAAISLAGVVHEIILRLTVITEHGFGSLTTSDSSS